MSNSADRLFPAGVITAALTPLNRDLNPDSLLMASHYHSLLETGGDGIVLLGTTGEANSFSVNERQQVLETAIRAGIPSNKLMIGTGCCAYQDTITLTRHVLDHGVENVLMLPPFYYKPVSDQGLFDTYARIIEGIHDDRLKIYLYHIPQNTGVSLSMELIARLIDQYPETVVGIKDSAGDLNHTLQLIKSFPSFAVYSGSEEFLLDNLRAGGRGCISATANVTLPFVVRMLQAYRDGKDVNEHQKQLTALRAIFKGFPFVSALKGFMSIQDEHWKYIRPPHHVLPQETIKSMYASFRHVLNQNPQLIQN